MSEKKPRAEDRKEKTTCLRCGRTFVSPDKRRIRICPDCKSKKRYYS